jgi:hypothetical protein
MTKALKAIGALVVLAIALALAIHGGDGKKQAGINPNEDKGAPIFGCQAVTDATGVQSVDCDPAGTATKNEIEDFYNQPTERQ